MFMCVCVYNSHPENTKEFLSTKTEHLTEKMDCGLEEST